MTDSTVAGIYSGAPRTRARLARRVILVLLAALVLLGASTLLGVRTDTKSVADSEWQMSLTYPRIARGGLDVIWRVELTHAGGFDGPITLRVTDDYFDIFETQGFHPEPASTTSDGSYLYFEFDPPSQGERFAVDYDAYIQGSSQLGRGAQVQLMEGERSRLSIRYRTWLLP